MVVVRRVFQAKYGKADGLVAVIKKGQELMKNNGYPEGRILTDLTGRMFTIVWESEFASLAAVEEMRSKAYAVPEFGPWFQEMEPLVESGSTEFYTVQ